MAPLLAREFTLDQAEDVASQLVALVQGQSHCVLALIGDLGAGKTTLVQAIARALDIADPISSPTFALVNTYMNPAGTVLSHYDLYRLTSEEQALEIGLPEMLEAPGWHMVEWPQVAESLLPDQALRVELSYGPSPDSRYIKVSPYF